ncbi:hypothetical protein Clacol_004296 [Clathrus columnatus]|uniref:Uncharacterized protein n=1 Tax=Clathrus columnatus TaxID=1419009 RepID=A0AAV5AAX5_9AGAM|nr:hypothetical protein Clacol_004296 [Clathrus columnatus]
MATAAAPPPPPTANQQRFKPSQPSKPSPKANLSVPKTSTVQTPIRDVIDLDEGWILELQAARQEEYKSKADSLYKDLLAALEKAGPFIDPAKANALQAAYQQELEKIRQSQQKEVDNVIEMERQARLWSLGAEDPDWAGWRDLREEQICILQNIQKESGWTDDDASEAETDEDSVQKQVREAAQEYEQTSRSFAEWQRTEPQRMRGRAIWRETWMDSQENIKERRQRDFSDFEARSKAQQDLYDRAEQIASEARLGSAAYRGNPSLATLFANGESFATWRPSASSLSDTPSRSSFTESQLSDTPNTTPASSVYINPTFPSPPRHSSARPVPIPSPAEERNRPSSGSGFYNVEERQRTPYGSFSASNTSRMHGAGHTPSPTPTSHMPPNANSIPSSSSAAAHAKSGLGETLPERWIPPDLAQHLPQKKPSMSFDKSKEQGPTRMKSALFGESPAPPHPPIPEERPSSSASEASSQRPISINNYHTQNQSSTSATTTDHHASATPAPRSSSYSYSFSSASASASATAASGIPAFAPATASVPLSSTSASTSTNRVPSASYQAPPAPGLRSKPLPQHPPATPPITTTNPTSSTSSSTTAKPPPFPSTHVPTQRQHTFPLFPSQPSPTDPKVFQPPSRSFSASSSSSFSGSIPSLSARTSSTSSSTSSASAATAAVPPTSPIEDNNTSRASSAAASASFASQAANQAKNSSSALHSAGHATQTPLNKTTFSQAQSQTQQSQTQAAPPVSSGYASNDEVRTKLRQQYVADEERRAEEERLRREDEERRKREQEEEERRRKEQEANERRAEEAKRRGEERRREEERRRQEEMARDAERREHERKARKAQAAAAAGMSGSYPGSGFGSMPNVSGMYGSGSYGMPGSTSGTYGGPTGSTSSGIPGAGNTSSSSSYSSAAAHATSPPTPPPTSTTSAAELWEMYEKQWVAMAQTSHLRFRSIPWPVMIQITSPEQLLPIRIAQFIFHPMHSQGKSKEKRIREALLKWHPDRFNSKWLHKIAPEDHDKVVDGAGRVVRALNELLNGVNSNGFGE